MKPAKRSDIKFVLPLLVLILFMCSCKTHSIDQETAVKIYVENLIVEEKYNSNPDSIKIQRQNVFKKYNLSKNDFDDFMKTMKDDREKWETFFREADSYLNELKEKGIVN